MTPSKILRQFTLVCSCILASFLLSKPALAQQELRYITDLLYVPLRSGQGNEFRIVNKGLRSGTTIYYVAPGDTDEWIKVRTAEGVEGWIRSQYIQEEETANIKLNRALSELAQLKKANGELSAENTALKSQNTRLSSTADHAQNSQANMAQELEKIKTLSAGAIELEQRYTDLLEKHQLMQTEKDVLTAENESLKSDTRINYMLYGAGLLILGMILAIVVPSLKPNKRYSEWR
ncbi:SH3 domain protein [Alteromonadaceae bacterium 2753L.S.0a.02]|nr:SH3 domain protein [Alteromonadaceae bacterium 2753L.S.0a.02]